MCVCVCVSGTSRRYERNQRGCWEGAAAVDRSASSFSARLRERVLFALVAHVEPADVAAAEHRVVRVPVRVPATGG